MLEFFFANIVFTATSALLVYSFLYFAFNINVSIKRILLFITFFSITNTLLSSSSFQQISNNSVVRIVKPIALCVLSILLIKLILKTTLAKSLFSFCIMGIGLGVGNACTFLILRITTVQVSSNINLYIIANIIITTIAFLFVFLSSYFKNHCALTDKTLYIIVVLVFFVICLFIGVYFYQKNFNIIPFITLLIITMIFCVVVTFYVKSLTKQHQQKNEIEQQNFYNKSLIKALQDLRHYKHDQANHLSVIYIMLKMKKYDDAIMYLNEIVTTTESLTNTAIFNIKNAGLFGIVSSKIDKSYKMGVKFDLETIGVIDSIPNVRISELCEVIGIYLDNAIEAAHTSANKIVEMTVTTIGTDIELTIKNSCEVAPAINKIKIDGYSTKGSDRGHGLSIVENILKKYTEILDIMRFDSENMQFIQTLKIKKGL